MNRSERRRQRHKAEKIARKPKTVKSANLSPGQHSQSSQQAKDQALRHHAAGRLPDAESIYRQILRSDPNQPVALHLLGIIAYQTGKNETAVDLISKALTIKPNYAEAHSNLGIVLKDQVKLDEAVASYHKALTIKPDYAAAHSNLGNVLKEQGKLVEAIASYHKALTIKPDYAEAHSNLGNALQEQGKLNEAVASYHKALTIKPDYVEAHSNLGAALNEQGKLDEAVASYHKAIAIKPEYAMAQYNLGNVLKEQGKLEEAFASYHKALSIKPDYAEAHSNLGNVLQELGKLDEAVASYHKALSIKPDYAEAHSNLIYCMNYSEHYSQQNIFAESRQWETNHAVLGTARKIDQAHDRDPERRLRIGYVSPNFRRHSVSYFLSPLIAGHDHRLFEVFCYAQVANPDNVTKRFRRLADGWCSTVGMTTSAIADRIRNDGIDILVDLAGHTANNRLLVFAERPAPVQVTWLGYPNTTGLSAMDYRLTDAVADPEGPGDNLHTETLIRLPAGFLCFTPAPETPPVTDPPVLANGHVTFGSFNNLSKVTASVVASWARILEAVPGSRLLLKNRSLADDGTRQRYSALFAERGISEERLIFHAWIASMSGHLGAYGRIDIGLDPFPYNGTTTTCEALWMGVPVITLQGDRHASRVGASILKTVGQGEMIADSVDDYVDAAVKLAENTDALTSLRRDLRPAMAASPLWDAAGFTRDVESAYRDMWRRWCHGA